MKNIDWQMIYFVGISLIKEFWYFFGLPRFYYWELKREFTETSGDDNNNKAA